MSSLANATRTTAGGGDGSSSQGWAFAAIALVALSIGPGCGRRERPAKVVRKLDIDGNHALSDRAIKKKILTAKTGWWPRADEKPFDPVAWDTDLQRVERLYESKGYYQSEVKGDVAEKPHERDVALRIQITEGQATRVESLTLRGLDDLPKDERTKVTDELPLALGGVFEEPRWNSLKDQLRSRLRDLGYMEAEVRGEARVDVESRRASITVDAVPGQRYRFADVVVRDAGTVVNRRWIQDEVNVALGKDRVFSDKRLAEAERRVFDMGAFSTVRVLPGAPDREGARVPVNVEVTDSPFRTLRLGFGVGVDQIRDEGRTFAEWTHRNWLGGLRKLRLRAQVGYAFLPSAYSVFRDVTTDIPTHGPVYLTTAELEQPRLFDKPTLSWRGLLQSDRRLEQAYRSLGARGSSGIGWKPWSRFTVLSSYNLQVSRVDAAGAITPDIAPAVLGCRDNPCVQWLSFLEQTATLDQRDHALQPRKGYLAAVSMQEGGGPLQGDFSYLRPLVDLRGYLTPEFFDDEFTFAARIQVGALFPSSGRAEDSPITERFYAGGANSMRGFNSRRLSPLVGIPPSGMFGDGKPLATLPIGGNGLVLGSFEMRYALAPSVAVAVFLDAGTVTRGAPHPGELAHLLYGAGVGLRIQTPVGPIRLDLARRLPLGRRPLLLVQGQPFAYQDDTSCFGIGGNKDQRVQTEGSCVLHISIGEAF